MAGTFRPSRGAPGYHLDWEGDRVVAILVEASRRGIDEISHLGANMARAEHIWENRSGQTEAAVFVKDAVVEWSASDPNAIPHVWGEWGIEDRPRYYDWDADHPEDAGQLEDVSTKDVGLFLEFGTVTQEARPWLYPAWDATKVLLPAAVKRHYEELSLLNWRPRGAGGRFLPFTSLRS